MKSRKVSLLMCVGSGRAKRGKNSIDDEDADTSSSTNLTTESMAYVQSILNNVKHDRKRHSHDKESMKSLNIFDDSKGLLMNISDDMNMMSTWSESLLTTEPSIGYLKDEHDINTDRTHFSTPTSFVSLDEPDSEPSFTELAMNSRFSVGDESRDIMTELEYEASMDSSANMGMTSAVEYMMSMSQLTKSSEDKLDDIEFSGFDTVTDYLSFMHWEDK